MSEISGNLLCMRHNSQRPAFGIICMIGVLEEAKLKSLGKQGSARTGELRYLSESQIGPTCDALMSRIFGVYTQTFGGVCFK